MVLVTAATRMLTSGSRQLEITAIVGLLMVDYKHGHAVTSTLIFLVLLPLNLLANHL